MAKNKISEFSSTPANNTDIGGIDIAEGCAPSGINNAIRELMAQLKDQQAGTDADNFTVGGNLSVTGNVVLGATPSAWGSSVKAIENESGSLFSVGTASLRMYQNAYLNSSGNNIYKSSNFATAYIQTSGTHQWFNAPSGTAGTTLAFTEAMTLTSDGKLNVTDETGFNINYARIRGDINYTTDSNSNVYADQKAAILASADGGNISNNQGAYSAIVASVRTGLSANKGSIMKGYGGQGGNTYNFRIAETGNVTNTNNSYGAISDVSLKENIVDANPKLDDLMQVKIRNYNLKSDENQTKQLGVVAQELESVFPAIVETDCEGIKSVKYSVFVPILIKAMQEQQALITNLTARLELLEGK
jgi:hypothetical protein